LPEYECGQRQHTHDGHSAHLSTHTYPPKDEASGY
jgi:hypothetical protein